MAYDQHSQYQQPPPQQYYNQGHPQHGQPQAGYNDHYEEYDQGQDGGWDDGYQQGYADPRQGAGWGIGNVNGMNGQRPPPRQQYQGGYEDMNRQPRQQRPHHPGYGPPQGRTPPARDPYGPGPAYNDPNYPDQLQEYEQRGPPMQPNRPVNSGMRRADMGGHGNGRGKAPEQIQHPQKPPANQRILKSPTSPVTLSQDNPFPTFPTAKGKPKPKVGSMDEAMALMSINDHLEQRAEQRAEQRGPPSGRGRGQRPAPQGFPNQGPPPNRGRGFGPQEGYEDPRVFPGSGRGQPPGPRQGYPQQRLSPVSSEARLPPQRHPQQDSSISISLMQQSFGPNTQRVMTLPQELPSDAPRQGFQGQHTQWAEPGPAAGYHGPESPSYIPPPRPSTATGSRQNEQNWSNAQPIQQLDSTPISRAPPAQPLQSQQPQQTQQPQQLQERRESLGEFYDDYYGGDQEPSHNQHPNNQEAAIEEDMPNFDAIPSSGGNHRRGYTIDHHLEAVPVSNPPPVPAMPQEFASYGQPPQGGEFYQQAQMSRSQPNLHPNNAPLAEFVFEMPGDIPDVPPISRTNSTPTIVNGLPQNPRGGRGPPPQMVPPNDVQGRVQPPSGQYFGPGQPGPPQGYAPNDARLHRPGQQRNFSAQSQWSDPGPGGLRQGPPQMGGMPIQRPQGALAPGAVVPAGGMGGAPVNQRQNPPQSRRSNPDALPQHPTPVRPGLLDQTPSPQPAKPPPVRQYNNGSALGASNRAPEMSSMPGKRLSLPHPVTHDELNRLRNTFKLTPQDQKTGLLLAKKLVEAANVLSDEGGRADARTRNKNREKFIFEAHKIVKKLVSNGYPDAMFYLADCYGQGLLGLEVDPKEAFTLYQSAAKGGHAASAYRTAVCCEMGSEEGGGTRRDPLKAVQWYKRAAALGDTPALYKMGMILLKGLLGQPKNLGEAINMLKRAAERADEENPHALHELGLLYEAQTGNERIIRDEAYALSLFKQAADLGYKFSQFRLGQAYEYGLLGCPIDARTSIAWYTRAAAQEEHQSELALSGWYLTGSTGILEQSDTEAYLWARKAAGAEPPLPKALFAMGYFTEVGIGCPRSLEEAKRWYGRAAAYKFPKAQERLEELKRGGTKVQKNRERLSRSNQKQHEADCVVM